MTCWTLESGQIRKAQRVVGSCSWCHRGHARGLLARRCSLLAFSVYSTPGTNISQKKMAARIRAMLSVLSRCWKSTHDMVCDTFRRCAVSPGSAHGNLEVQLQRIWQAHLRLLFLAVLQQRPRLQRALPRPPLQRPGVPGARLRRDEQVCLPPPPLRRCRRPCLHASSGGVVQGAKESTASSKVHPNLGAQCSL